jgi:lambda family phage portal protein
VTFKQRIGKFLITSGSRIVAQGFEAASRMKTRFRNWMPTNTEVNTLIVGDVDIMRARSRALARENPWGAGAIDSAVANTIGTGILPKSQHPDKAMKERINALWKKFAKETDADGTLDFYGQQSLVCRAVRTDGEVFIRFRYRRLSDGLAVPLQIQVIEADHCPVQKNQPFDPLPIRAGIKFNPIGKRLAYLMYKQHPGSTASVDPTLYEISADQILHVYEVRRPGQLRGVPWLTPAILMLHDIKQFMDASLLRAKIANLLSVFMKKAGATGDILPNDGTDSTESNPGGQSETSITELKPGQVHFLEPGEEPVILNPSASGVDTAAFLRLMLQAVARAIGITYEMLSSDLSGVNYSSIRAGVLEFRRQCEAYQYHVMIHQFCMPVWRQFIDQAILAGALGDDAAQQYAKDAEPFYEVRWDPPGWPWVDPLKDGMAMRAAVRDGFTSRQRICSEVGYDSEELDAEQVADNARADEGGLIYDSDGRNAEGKGDQKALAIVQADAAAEAAAANAPPPSAGKKAALEVVA